MKVPPINRIARDMAYDRRKWANRIVVAKKGKGSYNRKQGDAQKQVKLNNKDVDK